MSSMRIVFMGTPEFAVESLDQLIRNGFQVVAVITSPDKPAGRGQQVQQSAVKKYALEKGLPLLQPEKLKNPEFLQTLKNLKADLQFVVAFRMLPEVVWNMPPLGTYNLHASLLPKYRGAAPINWAVINGEKESGVTTFKLQHEIDSGNILLQEKVGIGTSETAGELHDQLMIAGGKLMVKTAEKIQEHFLKGTEPHFIPQDLHAISHAPKLSKEICRINWDRPAEVIYNFIRGLSPYPASFTYIRNGEEPVRTIKIFSSDYEAAAHKMPVGTLYTDGKNFLKIYCANGLIELTEIQLEGKKRMRTIEFLKGFKIKEGAVLF